ncbi:hypothetical protein YC2023_076847 [Brassica napus]
MRGTLRLLKMKLMMMNYGAEPQWKRWKDYTLVQLEAQTDDLLPLSRVIIQNTTELTLLKALKSSSASWHLLSINL